MTIMLLMKVYQYVHDCRVKTYYSKFYHLQKKSASFILVKTARKQAFSLELYQYVGAR